tara:strand:+ start:1198 stop:1929 length:732 start_codon:yes stop_codon:yes gene_type:complete
MSEFYKECEGLNLWVNLLITIIVSPTLLVIKILWDRCNKRRQESIIMNNKLLLEKISLKLQNFYWPLYIRLVKNHSISVKLCENSARMVDIEQKSNNNTCGDCVFTDPETTITCKNPVYCNSDSKYCLNHINYDITHIDNSYSDNMNKYFKTILLENYKEINNLIIKHIHIAEPNSILGRILIYYMKYSIIMIGLIETNKSLKTNGFNLQYPHRLLPLIERKLFKLQKKYNNLLTSFFIKRNK